jgi:hypothetical protein
MEDSYATMPGVSTNYGQATFTQPVGYIGGMSSPTMVGGVTGVPAVAGGSLPPGARYYAVSPRSTSETEFGENLRLTVLRVLACPM